MNIFKLLNKYQGVKVLHQLLHKFSNSGLIEDLRSNKDLVFGGDNSINKQVLQPDGQWLDFTPENELQKRNHVETMACVSFSLNNIIEMLAKRKWGKDWNKSDRYLAKLSGTTTRGNSMRKVLDTFRKRGSVNELSWPFGNDVFNWAEYYKTVPDDRIKQGEDFLKDYTMSYEMVGNHPNHIKEGLKYSPLHVAGYAWYRQGNFYKSAGQINHAFTIVGYEDGICWYAYDSYSPFVKKLAWNFKLDYCKTIYLNKKNDKYNMSVIDKLRERGLEYIMRPMSKGEVYRLTDKGLEYINEKEWNDMHVKITADQKKLVGITEDMFNSIIK